MPRRPALLFTILAILVLVSCRLTAQPTSVPPPAGTLPASSTAAIPSAPSSNETPALSPTPEPSTLAISAMRAKSYPGSDILLEQTLPGGPGYNRYIASYRSDGLKLFALLTVPTGDKPAGGWPVILLNHGYIPPAEYSTDQSYARIVAPLAQAGYIIFKPDYRGNGNSPGAPYQPYIAPDYVSDSLNALASIKKYTDADPDKIGVWGHSMGGNITLHELVLTDDFKAAVLMAGVVGSYSEILDWWHARVASGVLTTQNDLQTEQLVQQTVAQHGTPQSKPAFWNAIDPTAFVADVQTPVLIQVGTADAVVPPSFSQGLAARLRTAGKNVTLHTYPGADHNLSPDTPAALAEAIAFFNQYLK